ncbi:unnamed protein product [Caenorhabditis angaria]|uniref:Uncharacterized protein n=1 Tax=Caenorhabditis angaria TaxID=860376 RepID=A0A9P1MYL6_9PELO|nr:unnamed protein product [Caenorhabditis angaria]
MNTIFAVLFAVIFAIIFSSSQVSAQDNRPIFMNRREDSFGDILTELKGKGLGGRMRFGKRSGNGGEFGAYRSIYEPPHMEFIPLQ